MEAAEFYQSHIVLENDRVKLVPFGSEYRKGLQQIIFDESLIPFSVKCRTQSDLDDYIQKTISQKESCNAYPFIVIDKKTNTVAGSTRFGNIQFDNKRLEIGWTWYGDPYRGTGLNQACKYELLKFAFEQLSFRRVQLSTDIDNIQSQRAIIKLGATREGVFRSNYVNSQGHSRDDVYYSIIHTEWPEIRSTIFKAFNHVKEITVCHYDAFSTVPGKGNPAGVVMDGDSLSDSEMQKIAYEVGFNETAFVQKSTIADLRLRYYTPGHEINLCGHGTMAAVYCLKEKGLLGNRESIHIETNVGILPIHFTEEKDSWKMEMKQDNPRFMAFNGNVEKLAESIGLTTKDLDLSKPIVYGNTGTWTLLIPIKRLSSFNDMKPNNSLFPDILKENPKASIHPFCLETYDEEAFMHARHFSSPYSGTVEDPVTGTASGVMGAYYLHFIRSELSRVEFIVEQGQELERDGRVLVKAIRSGSNMDVYITGTAVFVKDMKIKFE